MWFALRATSAPRPAVRAAAILVAVELGQGVIGFVQYFTHLPELLVGLHMFGACLVWLATLDTLHHTRSASVSSAAPALPLPTQPASPAQPASPGQVASPVSPVQPVQNIPASTRA
jgi:cytochrome c oxidase assembly protein subunit 15